VVLILGTTLSLDIGHTDIIIGAKNLPGKLTSHDCGSREIHPDIDQINSCAACYRVTNFSTCFSLLSFGLPSRMYGYAISRVRCYHPVRFFDTHFNRGPPSFPS
jgi:hypothetical protein